MKINILILILIAIGSTNLCNAQLNPAMDKNRVLFMSDDFNTLSSSWYKLHNYDRTPEPQVMTNRADNLFVSSGILTIRTIKENYVANGKTYPFTSGWIQTYANYKYGYFEVRAYCPSGKGYWPAFWLQKGVQAACDYTEIDIFENDGGLNLYRSNANHYQTTADCAASPKTLTRDEWSPPNTIPILNTWHVWGCEWTPGEIIYYLDGIELRRVPNHHNQSMPIILNQSIYQTTDLARTADATTPITGDYKIDYVKLYRTTYDCSTVATITNFSTYVYAVKNRITVGDGSNALSVPARETVILRASQDITISNNFEVPLGCEFEAINTPCY